MSIEVIQSHSVFQGRVFAVRQDRVRKQDGGEMQLDIVDHADSVTILPVDDGGNIWFINQYRHPAGGNLLELPAGVIEEGESSIDCARREIQEEIKMGARRWNELGSFYLAPGYSTEYMFVFLARDLYSSPLSGDEDEIISIEKINSGKAYSLAETGQIRDVKTLGTLLLARSYLTGQS